MPSTTTRRDGDDHDDTPTTGRGSRVRRVDTHKDVHVGAALDELGRLLGTGSFATTMEGYRQLWRWLRSWGEVVAVGVEGTGSWGAGLARHLTAAGVDVREVMRPNRQHRRRYGKSDEADAIGAARAVLAGEAVGTPKAGTRQVEAIRLLRIARRSAMKARTQAGNQIHAVIDTAPEPLRRRFAGRATADIVTEAARFRRRHAPTTPLEAARLSLRTLARRWEYLDQAATDSSSGVVGKECDHGSDPPAHRPSGRGCRDPADAAP